MQSDGPEDNTVYQGWKRFRLLPQGGREPLKAIGQERSCFPESPL